ncbi:hypothetical protein BDQ17DRAFT_1349476 [Cyathus striatus]|nr:hypothetical protein BDQ17DRAFT_1349476 [Cyathus striatus]
MSAFHLAFFALCLFSLALAIPTWEGINVRGSIGSLVPGTSYIEALGPARGNEKSQLRHLSLPVPGNPGNLTVMPNYRAPGLFYVGQNQLWNFVNETAIFPVNAINVTSTSEFPLQLIVGTKQAGISTGSWRWRGTMLYYDQGSRGNQGLFYTCTTDSGLPGVFMFLQPSPTPPGCDTLTLHSFSRDHLEKF